MSCTTPNTKPTRKSIKQLGTKGNLLLAEKYNIG